MSYEFPVKDHLSHKTSTFAVMLLQIKVVHCISSEIAGGELVGGEGGGGGGVVPSNKVIVYLKVNKSRTCLLLFSSK